MFGLDDWIASFSDGATLAVVAVVAVVLGLRHASDPDHLAAVTTLIAGARERAAGAAAWLGTAGPLPHCWTEAWANSGRRMDDRARRQRRRPAGRAQ